MRIITKDIQLTIDGNVGDGSVVPHSWNEQNRPLVPSPCSVKKSMFACSRGGISDIIPVTRQK